MKQAAKKQLLNAQKVDGAIISEENGTIAFRKAPWNDTCLLYTSDAADE